MEILLSRRDRENFTGRWNKPGVKVNIIRQKQKGGEKKLTGKIR